MVDVMVKDKQELSIHLSLSLMCANYLPVLTAILEIPSKIVAKHDFQMSVYVQIVALRFRFCNNRNVMQCLRFHQSLVRRTNVMVTVVVVTQIDSWHTGCISRHEQD